MTTRSPRAAERTRAQWRRVSPGRRCFGLCWSSVAIPAGRRTCWSLSWCPSCGAICRCGPPSRGLGQWGALGYALDHGWSYRQILDHYYGGTALGSLGGDPLLGVRLTRLDGSQTAVMQDRGLLQTNAALGSFVALRASRVGP